MLAMLYRFSATSLIWEYLDGSIAPRRFDRLQRLLKSSSTARRRFVDCATLNAMLFAIYNPGRFSTALGGNGLPKPSDELCAQSLQEELQTLQQDLCGQDEPEQRQRRTKRPAG